MEAGRLQAAPPERRVTRPARAAGVLCLLVALAGCVGDAPRPSPQRTRAPQTAGATQTADIPIADYFATLDRAIGDANAAIQREVEAAVELLGESDDAAVGDVLAGMHARIARLLSRLLERLDVLAVPSAAGEAHAAYIEALRLRIAAEDEAAAQLAGLTNSQVDRLPLDELERIGATYDAACGELQAVGRAAGLAVDLGCVHL